MANSHERDDIDAILSDAAVDGDLTLLAAVMHDIRAEYVTTEPLERDPALLAYIEPVAAPLSATAPTATTIGWRVRRRGLQAAGLGLAGKVLLGTTLAAASVGGLQAADVIELPGLPDEAADQAVEVRPETVEPAAAAPAPDTTAAEEESVADEPEAAQVTAAAADAPGVAVSIEAHLNKDEAAEFVTASAAWHDCADDVPQAERVDTCGERPHPSDFGVTDPPGELARNEAAQNGASVNGSNRNQAATDAGSPSATAPGRIQDDGPGPPAHSNAPTDREVGRP